MNPHVFAYIEDLAKYYLIGLAYSSCTPFNDETLEDLEYIICIVYFNGLDVFILFPIHYYMNHLLLSVIILASAHTIPPFIYLQCI